jgi:hypothetical protein
LEVKKMPELSDEEVDKVVRQMALIHLTDPEMGQYHDEVIDDFNGARVEAHLQRCSTCKERYETMKHILATCHGVEVPEESMQHLHSLMAQRPMQQAAIVGLMAIVGVVMARAKKRGARAADEEPREIFNGQSEDGSLQWRVVEDDFAIVARYWSHRPELEGLKLAIKIGGLTKEVTLKRVPNNQVGGQTRIEGEERGQLPDDWQLRIESMTLPERLEDSDSSQ